MAINQFLIMALFDIGYFKHKPTKRKNTHQAWKILKRAVASELDYRFYDGSRSQGFGGYYYDGRWKNLLPKIINKYELNKNSRVLEIGCRKGFFLKDLKEFIPGIKVYGVEDHLYPIKNCEKEVKNNIKFVDKYYLINYPKKHFDLVISLSNIYRYNITDMIKTLRVISKISKKSWISVATYKNKEEKKKFENFSYLYNILLKREDWKKLFKYCGYKGDYYFTDSKSLKL